MNGDHRLKQDCRLRLLFVKFCLSDMKEYERPMFIEIWLKCPSMFKVHRDRTYGESRLAHSLYGNLFLLLSFYASYNIIYIYFFLLKSVLRKESSRHRHNDVIVPETIMEILLPYQ